MKAIRVKQSSYNVIYGIYFNKSLAIDDAKKYCENDHIDISVSEIELEEPLFTQNGKEIACFIYDDTNNKVKRISICKNFLLHK